MTHIIRSKRNTGMVVAILVAIALFIILVAPEEQTLGQGIRAVYIHVAFIWTGMFGLIAGGILGIVVATTGWKRVESWSQTLVWIALLLFAAGLGMSVVAARVNWGAVFWQEPRTNAALQVLAFGIIVQGLNTLPIPIRIKGALRSVPVLLMLWVTWRTPLVLHPRDPARSSSSAAIRWTFLSLFVIYTLGAAWILAHLKLNQEKNRAASTLGHLSPKRQEPTTAS